MNAIVTVTGKDKVGIIAPIATALSEFGLNIEDIAQTIIRDFFIMTMLVNVTDVTDFPARAAALEAKGKEIGVVIHVQHEDIFNAMHKI